MQENLQGERGYQEGMDGEGEKNTGMGHVIDVK